MLYLAKILIHKMKTFFQNIVKIFVGTFSFSRNSSTNEWGWVHKNV